MVCLFEIELPFSNHRDINLALLINKTNKKNLRNNFVKVYFPKELSEAIWEKSLFCSKPYHALTFGYGNWAQRPAADTFALVLFCFSPLSSSLNPEDLFPFMIVTAELL